MTTTVESKFYSAADIAMILGVSVSSAYRIIKKLNGELEADGKIIIPGKVSKRYFSEKVYL